MYVHLCAGHSAHYLNRLLRTAATKLSATNIVLTGLRVNYILFK
jgi:hypothetical protein